MAVFVGELPVPGRIRSK